MPRYIDADKIVIEDFPLKDHEIIKVNRCMFVSRKNGKSINQIKDYLKNVIENVPTEDVVPRAEVERYKTICQCYHKMFEKIQEEHCLEINNVQTELSKIILYEILNFLISDMQDKAKAFDKTQTQKDKDFLMGVMSYQSCIKSLITEQIKKYIGE